MTLQSGSAIWQPLEAAKKEIRLLALAASQGLNRPVSCTLKIVSLDDSPEYEAISYVWGDATVTTPMTLQGVEWPITTNLDLALRNIRDDAVEKIVWADAICVNQQDIEERSSQVPLMRDIYGKAKAVRIWLGELTDKSTRGFQLLEQITYHLRGWTTKPARRVLGKYDLKIFADIALFPWWRRTWTLQELALAKVAIFHLGETTMDADKLFSKLFGLINLYRELYGSLETSYGDNEGDDKAAFLELSNSLGTLSELLKRNENLEDWRSFLVFLALARRHSATDDKDRVFGLLGICPAPLRTHIVPNYHNSLAEIYQTFAYEIVRLSGSLAIFNQVMPSQNSFPGLSSWVPDWTSKHSFLWQKDRLSFQSSLFNACGGRLLKCSLLEGRILQLEGAPVDSVVGTGSPLVEDPETGETLYKLFREWRHLCHADTFWKRQARYIMGGSLGDAIWRTLLNDCMCQLVNPDHTDRRCEPSDRKRDDQWEQEGPNEEDLNLSFVRSMMERRLIIGEKGYIGLGPVDTAIGDTIYILGGGAYPYILRPSPDEVMPNTFTLVGEAYIHGIMDGQAFTGLSEVAELSAEEQLRLKAFGGRGPDPEQGSRKFEDIFLK